MENIVQNIHSRLQSENVQYARMTVTYLKGKNYTYK